MYQGFFKMSVKSWFSNDVNDFDVLKDVEDVREHLQL